MTDMRKTEETLFLVLIFSSAFNSKRVFMLKDFGERWRERESFFLHINFLWHQLYIHIWNSSGPWIAAYISDDVLY